MPDTTTSPTGYANLLMSQISPQHSFNSQLNSGGSHNFQNTRRDCDTNNTSTMLPEGLWALLDQGRLSPNDPDVNMISQLRREISELQHTVAFLQSEKTQLVNENLCLNTKCETLQTILVNSRGSASSTASSSSLSVASDSTADRKPTLLDVAREDSDHDLNAIDYPLVRSWTKKDWQENMPSSTSANPGSSGKKRGATRMARGINVACTYLQDQAGQPVSAQRAKTIRLFMLSCFRQLESQGLAPESIGQASLKVLHWLIHMLRKHYIELRLCADNWKAMKLMIDNYSQWYNYHVVKKQTSGHVKSEDIETADDDNNITPPSSSPSATPAVTPPSSSPSATPAVTPPSSSSSTPAATPPSSSSTSHKRVNVDIDPVAEPALKRQRVEVEDLSPSPLLTGPDNDLYIAPIMPPASPHTENEIPRHASPEREPTPPPRTDKGKEKEVITVEVNNPLSNLVFKPRPKPIPKKAPASIDSATSGTTSAEPTIITPPSNDPSDTNAASLAVKMELLVATPTEPIPGAINSKAQPAKKRQPSTKPMRVSSKITARNLCALEWQSNGHQKEPASVFATYWNSLSKTDKEVYKHKAALQLGSAGPTERNGAGDDADEE
ncbi:uncharacterized protein F5891DRAFT_1199872 [Suillus fuscotomentosus]|uniref:Uncharacterized protein n=1 Tax=Suillus fuscotomentosus TaxID=1912939 RepID=A0AAD4HCP1_9AGAM|nr:uncharacterized protein F5891DRAFT_1199872 [Suillus fuscotomentosus]KAG1887468.1 hypothetical protein F5891DRAFT_1199872 [Suillus fuscotomentosus]